MNPISLPRQRLSDGGIVPTLAFEPDGVEGSLQEMNLAPVGSDHQLSIGPLRTLVSADQKGQGELFEDGVVEDLEFVNRKCDEVGAGCFDVLDEKFLDGSNVRLIVAPEPLRQ